MIFSWMAGVITFFVISIFSEPYLGLIAGSIVAVQMFVTGVIMDTICEMCLTPEQYKKAIEEYNSDKEVY